MGTHVGVRKQCEQSDTLSVLLLPQDNSRITSPSNSQRKERHGLPTEILNNMHIFDILVDIVGKSQTSGRPNDPIRKRRVEQAEQEPPYVLGQ